MGHPSFAGILKAGQTLTATPGLWERYDTLTYQWLHDGEIIPGAVGETYTIPEADTGRSLALRVTASGEDGLEDGVETTLPSPKVSEANTAEYTAWPGITGGTPDVWGWSRVGFELSADYDLGSWSPRDIDVTMQWQADGVDIQGATGPTYRPKTADLGKRVTLKVTGGGVSMSNTAEPVAPGNIEPADEIYPNGEPRVGNTLTLGGDRGFSAFGETVSLHYQWTRDRQPISGATTNTYQLVAADQGHQIQAQVTATAPGYWPNTQSSIWVVVDGAIAGDGGTGPGDLPDAPDEVPDQVPPVVEVPEQAPPLTEVPDQVPPPIQVPAPVNFPAADYQVPVAQPPARDVPALNDVPAQVQAPVGETGGQIEEAVASAEAAPGAGPASPAVEPQAVAAPAAAAAPRPVATSTPEPAAVAAEKSSGSAGFNPLPLIFTLVGILIAAGLVLLVRRSLPLRRD